jgi:hypothetical protein
MSGDEGFLRRWSRLKSAPDEARAEPPAEHVESQPPREASASEPATSAPTPPIESLTPDSDFTPFMQADVDPALRRGALKKLFADPRFNVMDGLDVYIDDYSKPDPLPEGWLEKMTQVARLGVFRPPQEEGKEESAKPAEALANGAQQAALPALETDRPAESSNVAERPVPAQKNEESAGS